MAIRSLLSKVSSSLSLFNDDGKTSSSSTWSSNKSFNNNDHNDLDHNHIRFRHQSSIITSTNTIERLNNYHHQYDRFKLNNNVDNNANYKVKHYSNGLSRTSYLHQSFLIILIFLILINTTIINVADSITISAKPQQSEQAINRIWWYNINKHGNTSKLNGKLIINETNKSVGNINDMKTVFNDQHFKPIHFNVDSNKLFSKRKLNLIDNNQLTINDQNNENKMDPKSNFNAFQHQKPDESSSKKNIITDDELMTQASKLSSYMTRILPITTNVKRNIMNSVYDDSYVSESRTTSMPLDIKYSAPKNRSRLFDDEDLLPRSSTHSRQFFTNRPFSTHSSTSQFGTFHRTMPNNHNSDMESYSNRIWNFFDNNMSRGSNSRNQQNWNRFEMENQNSQSNFDSLFNTHFNKNNNKNQQQQQQQQQQKSQVNSVSTTTFKNNNKQQSQSQQQQTKQPNVLSLNLNHRRKNQEEKEKFRRLIQDIFDSTPRKTFSEFERANIANNNNVNGNDNNNLIDDNNDEKYTIQIKSNSALMDQMPQINHHHHLYRNQKQLHEDMIQLKQEHEDNNDNGDNKLISSNVGDLFEDQVNGAGVVKMNNNNNNDNDNDNSDEDEDVDDAELPNGDIVDKIVHNENGNDEQVNNGPDDIANDNKNNDHETNDNENLQRPQRSGNFNNSNRLNEHQSKEKITEDIGADSEGFLSQQQHSLESNESMDNDDNNNNNNDNANTMLNNVNGNNGNDNNDDDGNNINSGVEEVDVTDDKDTEDKFEDEDDEDESENETEDENKDHRSKEINGNGQKQPQLSKHNENYQTKSMLQNNIEQPIFGLRVSFNGKKSPIKQIIRKKNSILVQSTTMSSNQKFEMPTTVAPSLESNEDLFSSRNEHLIGFINFTNKETPSMEVTTEIEPELKTMLITKRKPQQLGKWMDAETFELKNDHDEQNGQFKNVIVRSSIPSTSNTGSTAFNFGIGSRTNAKKSNFGYIKKNSVYRVRAERQNDDSDLEEENEHDLFPNNRISNRAALEDNFDNDNDDDNVSQLFKTLPGVPKQDYPIFSTIPKTRFNCRDHRWQGYYADPETHCQVFHICQGGGRKTSFLCPNGTLFNQQLLICDWWHNVDCNEAAEYYEINGQIYGEDFESHRLTDAGQGSGFKPATVQPKPARISVRRMAVLENTNNNNNNQDDETDDDNGNAIDDDDNDLEEVDNSLVNLLPSTTTKPILNHTIIPITTTTVPTTTGSIPTTTTAPTFAPVSTETNRALGLTESVFGARRMSSNSNEGHRNRFQFDYTGTKGGSKANTEPSQFSRLIKNNRLKNLQQMKNATMVTRFVRHKFAHQSLNAKTTPLPQLFPNGLIKSSSIRQATGSTVNYSTRPGKYHRN